MRRGNARWRKGGKGRVFLEGRGEERGLFGRLKLAKEIPCMSAVAQRYFGTIRGRLRFVPKVGLCGFGHLARCQGPRVEELVQICPLLFVRLAILRSVDRAGFRSIREVRFNRDNPIVSISTRFVSLSVELRTRTGVKMALKAAGNDLRKMDIRTRSTNHPSLFGVAVKRGRIGEYPQMDECALAVRRPNSMGIGRVFERLCSL